MLKVSGNLLGVAALVCMGIASTAVAAPELPGQSIVAGQSIGQWTGNWWNWAESFGPGPFTDTTGSSAGTNQSGPIFFIAGSGGNAGPITRNITVSDDKYILLPLINWIVAGGPDPGFADTQSEATALATNTIDPTKLFATIDGTPVANLASHREATSGLFALTFAPNNDSGFPPGTYNDAAADGYYLMLSPLSDGPHTLHFGGTSVSYNAGAFTIDPFSIDVTVNLNVVPAPGGGGNAAPLPPGLFAGAASILPVMMIRRRILRR